MPDLDDIRSDTYRVLLVHPRAATVEQIAEWYGVFLSPLTRLFAPTEVKLYTGLEEWDRYSASIGGFKGGWAAYVATAETPDGLPYYNAIVVTPNVRVGRATASIVGASMLGRKPVAYGHPPNAALYPVGSLVCHDPNDFQTGWEIRA